MTTLRMRYFAAAAEAAGCERENLDVAPGLSLAEVKAELIRRHGAQFEKVSKLCAFLVEGRRFTDADLLPAITDEVKVDVLPPFAGG